LIVPGNAGGLAAGVLCARNHCRCSLKVDLPKKTAGGGMQLAELEGGGLAYNEWDLEFQIQNSRLMF
jgi:hypothetical protein